MRARDAPEELLDPAELGFRADSVHAGGWITFVACIAAGVYTAGWAPHHQAVLGVLLGIAFAGGAIVLRLPWERILRSRARECVFLVWSALDIAIVIALAALDGGADSPLALLIFIPIVFAGASYPRLSVLAVSVAVIVAYFVLALASQADAGGTLMFEAALALVALMSFWQARNHERRRALLLVASRTDPLTGSLNRRGFQQAAEVLLAGVERFGHPASLALLDLDRFKAYNDAHGHAAGDELLCWAVERMRLTVRPTDTVARMGGDEFAILLAGADRDAAETAIARVRAQLVERVQISCGLASAPSDGDDVTTLYRSADAALYEAKRAARSPAPASAPAPDATTA